MDEWKFIYFWKSLILGFYRVNYDSETWENIATTLRNNASQIHVLNRAQVRVNLILHKMIRLKVHPI